MEKQLGWTTIEQSEKLIKAGLNPNTADMSYLGSNNAELSLASYSDAKERFKDKKSDFFKVTPCWSLGVLINLMPKYLTFGKEHFDFVIIPWLNQVQYINLAINSIEERTYMESRIEKTLIDSIVSIIERLLACKSTYLVKVKSGLI